MFVLMHRIGVLLKKSAIYYNNLSFFSSLEYILLWLNNTLGNLITLHLLVQIFCPGVPSNRSIYQFNSF